MPILQIPVPPGRALVVSSLVFVALQSAADGSFNLLGVDNPYLLIGRTSFQPAAEGSLTSLGQYGVTQVGTGAFAGVSKLNTNLATLLGWGATNPGIVVGAGGSFSVTAFALDAIGAGSNVPTHVGAEVGGFTCPQDFAVEMVERGGAVAK